MSSKAPIIAGPLVDVAAIQRQLKQAMAKSKAYDAEKIIASGYSPIVSAAVPHSSQAPAENIQVSLSPEFLYFSTQRKFHISDFLYVSEGFFIESLFVGVLRRNIEPSAKEYWRQFDYRSRVQRMTVINQISASPEGKSRRVKIKGLKRYTVLAKLMTLRPLISLRHFLVRKVGF